MIEGQRLETFHISTFGCQMNLADSSTLAATLTARGYRRVSEPSQADIIIFNTCSVREKAEERVLGRLGEIHRFKLLNPHVRIAVVGCMAQRLGDRLRQQVPFVDYVLGTDREFELPDVISGIEGTQAVMTAFGHEDMDVINPTRETPYSAFVTISRGCDNWCTYCIVPYVRGRERAHAAAHVIDSIRKLADEGVVEITLLGQNVNSYRHEEVDFPELIRRVAEETPIQRIRYMTSHPKDLSDRLVDIMARQPRIMPHVHLPMQSGCNRVLERMGRAYSIEHYMEIVRHIRSKLSYVSLTTDLIVGFPSETEAEYEQTLTAVEEIQFDAAFMFRYSTRPGTKAAAYDDDVLEDEKIRRLNKLIALQQQIGRRQNQREVGRVSRALVEGTARRDKTQLRARTEGNKIVVFHTDKPVAIGSVVPIRITAADAFTLHGRLEGVTE